MMACTCSSPPDIYLPEPATVLRAEQVTAMEKFFEFKPDSGRPLNYMPGQFMQISVPGIGEAPISISSSPTRSNGTFQMVVRRVGNVTSALHRLAPGAKVGIRGPYGTNFPVESVLKGRDLLFICGGIGLVPVRSAIHYVLDNRDDYGKVTILFGAKSPAERLFLDELAEWAARDDVEFMETVDRGDGAWKGNTGVITTLLPRVTVDPNMTTCIVCGPPIMYKFVLLGLSEMKVPTESIYLSLERHMKCGVGKCGHCQINGIYVCQEGPVFQYSRIEGVREAIQ